MSSEHLYKLKLDKKIPKKFQGFHKSYGTLNSGFCGGLWPSTGNDFMLILWLKNSVRNKDVLIL